MILSRPRRWAAFADVLDEIAVARTRWFGGGHRVDPSGKGRAMKDWLEGDAEPGEWVELALAAPAFTAGHARS